MKTKTNENPVFVKFLSKFFDKFGFDNYDVLCKQVAKFGIMRLVSHRLSIPSIVLSFVATYCQNNDISYYVEYDENLGLLICLEIEL